MRNVDWNKYIWGTSIGLWSTWMGVLVFSTFYDTYPHFVVCAATIVIVVVFFFILAFWAKNKKVPENFDEES